MVTRSLNMCHLLPDSYFRGSSPRVTTVLNLFHRFDVLNFFLVLSLHRNLCNTLSLVLF